MDAEIITTKDGSHSLHSKQFEVTYHSIHGAIQETQHVFIDAALKAKAKEQKKIAILDIGFGTGLNAFMTLLEAEKEQLDISYTGIEAFPITLSLAESLNYLSILPVKDNLKNTFIQLHELAWNLNEQIIPQFSFIKHQIKFEQINFENKFDIIYFDAFAPTVQPTLWENILLEKMHKALKKDGIMTTYCAKGVVKRTLKAVGFEVIPLPGPPGKREMTKAIKI